MSRSAVFTALWLTGVDLNITALIGMTVVIGIGTKMAIFLVSGCTELAHETAPRRALREASRNRLRPISMTTLAASLTLMPLTTAIVAGLLLRFPLALLAMPVPIGLTLLKADRDVTPA